MGLRAEGPFLPNFCVYMVIIFLIEIGIRIVTYVLVLQLLLLQQQQ